MPFASEKQRRAMYAAAAGRGKVGISQSAAKSFIAHSKKKSASKGRKRKKKSR